MTIDVRAVIGNSTLAAVSVRPTLADFEPVQSRLKLNRQLINSQKCHMAKSIAHAQCSCVCCVCR